MSSSDRSDLGATIRQADRPRSLSEIERRRLRLAFEREVAEGRRRASLAAHDDGAGRADVLRPAPAAHRPRRAVAALTVAASLVAALGLLAWYRVPPTEPERPASTIARPLTAEAVRQICDDDVAAVNEAVRAWGSIDDWSASVDGEPDLGRLTADALVRLAEFDDRLIVPSGQVRAVVSARESFQAPPGPLLVEHAALVRGAHLALVESLARIDPEGVCPTASIRAELTR